MPLASIFAILTRLEIDAKNMESEVIGYLLSKVNASGFDTKVVLIQASSNMVSSGEEYSAEIFLTSYSSKHSDKVFINGQPIEIKDGKGIYRVRTTSEGIIKYSARITVIEPTTGKPKDYTADGEYQVFSPIATISASKMNLFYAGIDNPVEISVPGYNANQLNVECENGSIIGSNGMFYLQVQMGAYSGCKNKCFCKRR